MPMDPRVSAGVAAMVVRPFNGGDHLLMIRRKGKHAAGLLSCPGGWIDYGESPEQAALRELNEEVGLVGYDLITALTVNLEPEKCASIIWLPLQGCWPPETEFFPGLYSLLTDLLRSEVRRR